MVVAAPYFNCNTFMDQGLVVRLDTYSYLKASILRLAQDVGLLISEGLNWRETGGADRGCYTKDNADCHRESESEQN